MTLPRPVTLGFLLAAWMTSGGFAQNPPPSPSAPARPQGNAQATQNRVAYRYQPQDEIFPPIPTDPSHPSYYAPAHKSVVRHNPLPYREQDTFGYRNPGGVGRNAEYYPPGNRFQIPDQDPVRAAQFDQGPEATRRSAQLQSEMVGVARAQQLQNQINSFSRPMGWGMGYGGGSFYGYPY